MRQHRLVRGPAACAAGLQQRGIEPAAMLVGAFEIERGRPFQLGPLFQHESVRRAGIEPHLDDVGDLVPLGGIILIAEKSRGLGRVPDIGALALDRGGDPLDDRGVAQGLAALLVDEDRDRHPPAALPRDAPIRFAFDHRRDAVAALRRDPAGLVNGLQRLLAQPVRLHRDEPLRRVAEDQRRLRAPRMRVGMHQRAARQETAGFLDRLGDRLVGVTRLPVGAVDGAAGEQRHARQIDAVRSHRVGHRQAVGLAQFPVIGPVPRRDVHETGAGIGGDKIGREQWHVEIVALPVEGVARDRAGERRAGEARLNRVRLYPGLFRGLLDQGLGDEQLFAGLSAALLAGGIDAHNGVVEIGAECDRAIAGQGPGRRRPDHRRSTGQSGMARRHDRKAHPDRVRAMVVILDLCLGERGLLDDRPQDRLRALVEAAIAQKLADLAHDLRLGVEAHRQIRVVPIADDAEPLKLLFLLLDPMGGKVAAFLAELRDRDAVLRLVFGAVFLFDDPLDRQAVAVPARHIGRILAQHLLGPVDDVLQDLVERVAEMQVAIGIGRAVMEHEFLAPLRRGAQLVVKTHLLPALDELWLERWQAAAHREVGFRQEDSRTVIRWHDQPVE